MHSRRTFLASAAGISLTTAGCLDRLPSSKGLYGFSTHEPIFTDDQDRWQESPFEADVFSTPEEATDALNTEMVQFYHADEYLEFNPNREFLAVCASTLEFVPEGTTKGWCPRREIDGDKLVFQFPFEEWPDELDDSFENRVIMNLWNRRMVSPPTSATVELQFLDGDEGIRTCSD